MRRSRFATAIEQGRQELGGASVSEALWFDVLPQEIPDEDSLASARTAGFQHAPLLLGATHLLIAVAAIYFHPQDALRASIGNPLVPLGLILLLVAAAGMLMHLRG